MQRRPSGSGPHLEPPRKSVELLDTGARELESSDGEEYFSDASEGRRRISRPVTPSSPIPRTRVEKVDDVPSHGQIPGSAAYGQRLQDAVPDEVEVVPEGRLSKRASSASLGAPRSPGGSLVPRTVVEKVDPSSPSHGDIPGTAAYEKRLADATPDLVLKATDDGRKSPQPYSPQSSSKPNFPIPETIVTRVDSFPAHGETEGTAAYDMRKEDAEPDELRIEGDVPRSPTLDRSLKSRPSTREDSPDESEQSTDNGDAGGFGDEFDDFEEGAQAGAEEDFGDFDDDFEEAHDEDDDSVPTPTAPRATKVELPPSFPLLDMEALSSIPDLLEATKVHLDAMFPQTTLEKLSSIPEPESLSAESPIFPSDRSRSLWKQLITPPPLQPPNWTKSRIRRLFLVSLGVPIDLDEILPPSKQKKLVLPDINLEPSSRKSESDRALGSVARLKSKTANDSTASIDSNQSASKQSRRRPKGPQPPPELDLAAVKRLCATTNEKLDGFTDEELQSHVTELQSLTEKTSELLEYWLKRRDGTLKEKEAFEGVIENLVKHARRVRK